MKSILDLLSEEVGNAFEKAGYKKEAGKVSVSNRPDLCEYQCNGAMALAKEFKCAPKAIADAVVAQVGAEVSYVDVYIDGIEFAN